MIKKVGIVTFHYVDNYGAVLQAWALRKVLNKMENIEAEIVNYVPKGYSILPYNSENGSIHLLEGKREKFEKFLWEKCNVNSPMIDRINGEQLDFCCVGSDQVWNMSLRENADKEYLLPNLNDKVIRFSYAASIGGRINKNDEADFISNLKKYAAIAVREDESIHDLDSIGIKGAISTIDPTLLLNASDYEEIIKEPTNSPDRFLLFFSYTLDDEEIRKIAPFVNRVARDNKLEIVHSMAHFHDWLISNDSKSMIYEGIEEFLWYIKNASVIVTTSFHGAIFGYIFKRPTYIICRKYGKERLINIGKILGMTNCFVDNNWIGRDWTIEGFHFEKNALETKKKESMEYLKGVLNE